MKLKDKVCIVTGATSGMGKAIAESFSSEGAKLILSGRNQESGKALENGLNNALFVPGDVTDPSYNKKLVQTAMETHGKLDILSLNAGILGLGNVQELSIDSWRNTIDTNLSSIFYLCKHALPQLQKQPQGNILINASIAAFKSFPNHPAYCASKAASVALMKQVAVDYAPKIRVNAICPGPVDTPLLWESAQAFENPDTAVENAKRTTLLKRLGAPEDIAKLVLFLVSEDSSWITGTTVTIDGGIINT
ncbi:MAG TPA: oxidoreductase [Muricauda sp.]|uniref:SDR family oxidoreductase n=1 Tax=Flagellimonas aurea TaxID=2915619 RepID=A0ABS3G7A1_9FLAO|nr:SDR family oxidoreductase [Allomuricauda aurea]MAO18775.1 oxidoreductase [Allomuricauda sp.]MBO0355289.1 SDR family oxidoreductase [Allomuricauda aurea]HBU78448.1 oxidoreductase [Allomuricauda sp.]|tara:strand:+ start:2260 stop:3006 length:747 start_codon:yes stop_codon:yes gene_type:complete